MQRNEKGFLILNDAPRSGKSETLRKYFRAVLTQRLIKDTIMKETKIKWKGQTFFTKATPDMIKVFKAFNHNVAAHRPDSKEIVFLDSKSIKVV